jgi:hypothetical protein
MDLGPSHCTYTFAIYHRKNWRFFHCGKWATVLRDLPKLGLEWSLKKAMLYSIVYKHLATINIYLLVGYEHLAIISMFI